MESVSERESDFARVMRSLQELENEGRFTPVEEQSLRDELVEMLLKHVIYQPGKLKDNCKFNEREVDTLSYLWKKLNMWDIDFFHDHFK